MLEQIIGGFVLILIIVTLIPMINEQISIAGQNTISQTPWTATLLKIIPALFALGILGIGIAVAWNALKGSGVVGDREGLEGKMTRTADWTTDGEVIYDADDTEIEAEVRKAIEPPKYFKESQLRQIEEKYKPVYDEKKTKFDA